MDTQLVNSVGLDPITDGGALPRFVVEPVSTGTAQRDARWPVLRRLLVTADIGCSLMAGAVAGALAGLSTDGSAAFTGSLVAAWLLVAWLVGLYAGDDLRSWASGVPAAPRLAITALVLSWALYAIALALGAASPAIAGLAAVGLATPLSGAARGLARAAVHRKADLRQRTLILGSGVIAAELVAKLRSQDQFGLDPVGFLDDDPHVVDDAMVPRLGRIEDLGAILDAERIDRVIVAFSRCGHDDLLACIRACRDRRVPIDVVPRLFEFLDGVDGLAQVAGLPLMSITVPQLATASRAAKRALDIAVSAGALALLSPVLLTLAAAIKLESRGPVLFRQTRMGRSGRHFQVFKFRSMYRDAEARKVALEEHNEVGDGVMFKIREDPRVTRVGRIIRRYSLDELPQLINVLRGDMSLVGPRPLILPEACALTEDWHARRLDLRPGITGPWQISGRSDVTVNEMVRFDYAYVSGWSLARDLDILFATVPAVLAGRGAY